MSKILHLFTFFIIFYVNSLQIDTCAPSALIMNLDNGKILYEKNSQQKRYPASLTKIATALFVLEKISNLNHKVFSSEEALKIVHANTQGSKVAYHLEHDSTMLRKLKSGNRYVLDDLLHAMLIFSSNESANIIAESMFGSIDRFMQEINAYLKEMGCVDTHFVNPHGLHSSNHYSSGRDLACISKKAMENKKFCEIVNKTSYTIADLEMEVFQTNLLLKPGPFYYSKAFGVKTGYTKNAGYNLVAAATDLSRRVLIVLLGCPNQKMRFEEAKRLFECIFSEKKEQRVLVQNTKRFTREIKGASTDLIAYLPSDVRFDFYPSEQPKITLRILWDKIELPVKKDQKVASLVVFADHKEIQKIDLLSENLIKKNFLAKVHSFFNFFK